jgi:hypothetical protein
MMTSKKVVTLLIAGLGAGVVFVGTSSCVRARRERGRLRAGMSVPEAFRVLRDWDFCLANSGDPATKEFSTFFATRDGRGYSVQLGAAEGPRRFATAEGVRGFIRKETNNGRAWHIQFTYFGMPRSTFRADFDAQGKVRGVSEIVFGP